jgi:hypothetical protein
MKRQKYVSPTMEISELPMQQKLLFGSKIDDIVTDGLFDDDLEQENFQEETPESIWEEAW